MLIPLFARRLWLPSATKSVIRSDDGVRNWIANGNWSPEPRLTKKQGQLTIHELDEFGDASINDAIRFANAAFESASAISTRATEQRGWAWQLISYYYAGYFAANALMRLSGRGCMNLSAIDCSEINQQASLFGVGGTSEGNKFSPGVFYSWVDHSKTPKLHFSMISAKGGVHIQFWNGFLKFLADIEHCIKTSPVPKSDITDGLSELKDLIAGLTHSGSHNGAWLSEIRNAANYRLEFGIWFPYSGCTTDGLSAAQWFRAAVSGSTGLPRKDQSIEELERAVRISGALLSWLRESLVAIQSTASGRKRRLIDEGVIAFLKNI